MLRLFVVWHIFFPDRRHTHTESLWGPVSSQGVTLTDTRIVTPEFWVVSYQDPKLTASTASAGTSQYSALTARWLHYIHHKNWYSYCVSIETVFRKFVTYCPRCHHNDYTNNFLILFIYSFIVLVCQHWLYPLANKMMPFGVNNLPLDSFKYSVFFLGSVYNKLWRKMSIFHHFFFVMMHNTFFMARSYTQVINLEQCFQWTSSHTFLLKIRLDSTELVTVIRKYFNICLQQYISAY